MSLKAWLDWAGITNTRVCLLVCEHTHIHIYFLQIQNGRGWPWLETRCHQSSSSEQVKNTVTINDTSENVSMFMLQVSEEKELMKETLTKFKAILNTTLELLSLINCWLKELPPRTKLWFLAGNSQSEFPDCRKLLQDTIIYTATARRCQGINSYNMPA